MGNNYPWLTAPSSAAQFRKKICLSKAAIPGTQSKPLSILCCTTPNHAALLPSKLGVGGSRSSPEWSAPPCYAKYACYRPGKRPTPQSSWPWRPITPGIGLSHQADVVGVLSHPRGRFLPWAKTSSSTWLPSPASSTHRLMLIPRGRPPGDDPAQDDAYAQCRDHTSIRFRPPRQEDPVNLRQRSLGGAPRRTWAHQGAVWLPGCSWFGGVVIANWKFTLAGASAFRPPWGHCGGHLCMEEVLAARASNSIVASSLAPGRA